MQPCCKAVQQCAASDKQACDHASAVTMQVLWLTSVWMQGTVSFSLTICLQGNVPVLRHFYFQLLISMVVEDLDTMPLCVAD